MKTLLPLRFIVEPETSDPFRRGCMRGCIEDDPLPTFRREVEKWNVDAAIWIFVSISWGAICEKIITVDGNKNARLEQWLANDFGKTIRLNESFPAMDLTEVQGLLHALQTEEKIPNVGFGGAAALIGNNGSIRPREVLIYLNGVVDRFYLEVGDVAQEWFAERNLSSLYDSLHGVIHKPIR